MEMEFEKMPSLATKFKSIQRPEAILFKERSPQFLADLEAIVRTADSIRVYYDWRVKETVEQYQRFGWRCHAAQILQAPPGQVVSEDSLKQLFAKVGQFQMDGPEPSGELAELVSGIQELKRVYDDAYANELKPLVSKELVMRLLQSREVADVDAWLEKCAALRSRFSVTNGLWDKLRVRGGEGGGF